MKTEIFVKTFAAIMAAGLISEFIVICLYLVNY